MLRGALPRLGDALFISILGGCLLLGARMVNIDSDLGRHLTLGNFILNTGTIPANDILSFTRIGDSRPPYEWLSQIAFALANRWLGLGGVVLLTGLAIASAFWIVFVDALDRGHAPLLASLFTGLSAAASSLHWLTRPHVLSFAFFALWLRGLERLRSGRAVPLWLFPVTMLVWANAHGGFVLGFLAWAAYLAGWLIDARSRPAPGGIGTRLALAGTTSLLASIITPDTWHSWEAVLRNRSPFILSRTAETMPPDLLSPASWPFLLLLGLGVLGLLLRFGHVVAAHALLFVGLGLGGLMMARNIPFFAIAGAPVLVAWGSEAIGQQTRWAKLESAMLRIDRVSRGFVWPALFVGASIGWLSSVSARPQSSIYSFDPRVFPVGAADWVESNSPRGNMLNDFNWGGYLLYRLWPQHRVFIDSQSDFYGEAFTRQYEELMMGGTGWQSLVSQYDIDWAVVQPSSGISQALRADSAWRVLYGDNTAVVYGRSGMP